tara:strand:+ start:17810 stop:19768 length:1959 start_codon:yes stop_codon:yes gene_type:complete
MLDSALSLVALLLLAAPAVRSDTGTFEGVEPILMDLCYDCHGDGMEKGDFAMDKWDSVEEHLKDFNVWYEIWKNIRSNLMPPANKKQFKEEERAEVLAFIESKIFKIDRENPDPGRVTIRRLNREEYRYTVKDIFKIDLDVENILPPDDTGYGFDTIGDVLSISPLLMEKYLEAARLIVTEVVPLDGIQKDYPEHVRHLFPEGLPPNDKSKRDIYRHSILSRVATIAFRRPVDKETIERLVAIAHETDERRDSGFESGIQRAMIAILVSPRFLMRAEIQTEPDNPSKVVAIDEFALASRLSYFLWSSCPDEQLLDLAAKGELRKNLRSQVDRMLSDIKAQRFFQNFVGQWLQARDVQTVFIDVGSALDAGSSRRVRRRFSGRLRQAMKDESELFFQYVLNHERPATELLTANYSFLNEELANWYDVEGIRGSSMRYVELPKDSKRGGLLNQATFQIVTSNPTRTSPVKRGLFVLENFLATPAPPAVPDVPALEDAGKRLPKNVPLRELLELHAEDKMCASCHARMDPIGLALENFNQIGLWRDEEKGQPIDASGKLITGESFSSAKELSQILATDRKSDFHRALSEKLLTYAAGRGVEYFDAPTIDKIVADVEANGGTLKEIIYGVIESAPFQKRRGDGGFSAAERSKSAEE